MFSTLSRFIFGVMRLTRATTTKPPTIATAPQSMGFISALPSIMFTTVSPTPHTKQAIRQDV